MQEEFSLQLPSCAAVAEDWSCFKMIFFSFLTNGKRFWREGRAPSIWCFIFFKSKRWQKAAGAPLCQEYFWQALPPKAQALEENSVLFSLINLHQTCWEILRQESWGKIFLPFLSFSTALLLDFLLDFGFLAGYGIREALPAAAGREGDARAVGNAPLRANIIIF